MREQMKVLARLAVAAAVALAANSCDGTGPTVGATGEPFFGGHVRELTVDFGPVLLGARTERKIVVVNEGRGAFTVDQAAEADGFDPSFRYSLEPFRLDVGGTHEIPVVFEPKSEGAHASTVSFKVKDGSIGELKLNVTGVGVNGRCVLAPTDRLEFGVVAVGESFIKQLKISNSSDLDWKLNLGGIRSETDAGVFTLSEIAAGEYTVPGHGELVVSIEFRPNHLGEHTAFLEIPGPAACQPSVLPLTGVGVDDVLECEPTVTVKDPDTGAEKRVCRVDFGYVDPGSKKSAEIAFKNVGNTDIEVTLPEGIVQPPEKGSPFVLEGDAATEGYSVVVPKEGGRVTIPVAFRPTALGDQAGKLKFASDDSTRPGDYVELAGIGGGPDIDAVPSRLDFGSSVTVGAYQYRRLTIANVGTDVAGTADDNLKLVKRNDETGVYEDARPELITDSPDEFSLEWPPYGYGPAGIEAGSSITLRVKFSPIGPGQKTATVRIWSNDPDEPFVDIEVAGSGNLRPPCDYEVVPGQLNYGNVEVGQYRTMSFYIVNLATNPADECEVSTLAFELGAADTFALPSGPIAYATIKGGESLEVPVRFSPTKDGAYSGAIEFYVSSVAHPEGRVQLSGNSTPGCLMIAPNDLDFGVIGVNCSSRERSFSLYNTCPNKIRVDSINLQAGLSNEFTITQRPVMPRTLSTGEQVEFKATYRPVDVGEDTGSIAVMTPQLPQPYVATIRGRGATSAVQTDVFAQSSQPKVDVLLVVDDSCSMADKQTSLGVNFASFISFAAAQHIDYHIAVTTTSVDVAHGGAHDSGRADDENGRFVPITSPGTRVITPQTPNAQAVFAQNVRVGTDGNPDEALLRPAYLALSNPNIISHNSDFLRDEAYLAVVVVSDALDHDAASVAFYQSFFLNLKGFSRANMLTFNGIIPTQSSPPPDGGCTSYDEWDAGMSPRVRELVTRTGGVYDEICTLNWARALEKIGRIAFGARTRFFLSNEPDMAVAPEPITITVDGQAFPRAGPSGETRWSYDSAANAIDFDAMTAPEAGATITVTYHVACH